MQVSGKDLVTNNEVDGRTQTHTDTHTFTNNSKRNTTQRSEEIRVGECLNSSDWSGGGEGLRGKGWCA